MIDQFREKHPNFSGELILDYFETYKPVELFDVIVMGFVLEHVDNPELILTSIPSIREARRQGVCGCSQCQIAQ